MGRVRGRNERMMTQLSYNRRQQRPATNKQRISYQKNLVVWVTKIWNQTLLFQVYFLHSISLESSLSPCTVCAWLLVTGSVNDRKVCQMRAGLRGEEGRGGTVLFCVTKHWHSSQHQFLTHHISLLSKYIWWFNINIYFTRLHVCHYLSTNINIIIMLLGDTPHPPRYLWRLWPDLSPVSVVIPASSPQRSTKVVLKQSFIRITHFVRYGILY